MGKGRAPCCDKSKVKRGPWSPAEDMRLISFIQQHGHGNWRALPKLAGLLRCGKSCRLRWINYLRPDVKRGNFSPEEELTIINLHKSMGNKWSKIASHLPGRTDNEIKNVWNTYLKKKLINRSDAAAGHGHHTETSKDSSTSYSASPSPSSSSCISYGDLNLDKGPGKDQYQDQEGQESNTFDPSPTTVLSSVGQHKSNDGAKPMSLNTNANANDDSHHQLQTSVTGETSKECFGDEIIEIPLPLESDIGIWSMFEESFDLKGESNIAAQPPEHYELCPRPSLGEGHEEEELEYQKWLRYLENELGLLGGTDSDPALKGEVEDQRQQQQLVTRGTEKEMILRPAETDPDDDYDMAYFPMWPPSSPQNFDF